MIYEDTAHNMIALMHTVGTLYRKQIFKFFSDEMSTSQQQRLLNEMVKHNLLKYDPETDRYTFSGSPKVKEEFLRRRLYAFWVIANMGSNNVVQIDLLPYPFQFSVIDIDNHPYDIMACYSEDDAMLAQRSWDTQLVKGYPDNVNHIALVAWESVGKSIAKYGFDSYCTLNKDTLNVSYRQFSGE